MIAQRTPQLPAAVLWDMDGTLVDSEKLWDVAVRELSVHLGGPMSDETRARTIGATSADALAIIFDSLGLPQEPDRLAEAKDWLFERIAGLLDAEVRWQPGAQAALELTAALGIRNALVTNTERVLTEPILDFLGRDRFEVSVCGDEVARGKPAPDPYLRGAALLGVPAERCLVIEDSPTGSAAGVAAGAAVLVAGEGTGVVDAPRLTRRASLVGLDAPALAEAFALGWNNDRVKTFEELFAELTDKARTRPEGSGTVAALDAGVHTQGKKIVEEAGEVWLAAEHESDEALAEEISQLLYWLQVVMIGRGLSLSDVYKFL